MKEAIQLTFGPYGHTLHHNQVISPDNQWIVYDTRNDDSQIGTTTRIERVNHFTKEIEVLYEVPNSNQYGPGVGAVTYSPVQDRVIFIHGISNASKELPYGMSRRSGVAIDINKANLPIYMDARNIYEPFTKGALRGGTHSHAWNADGNRISFTYNDFVLEQNGIPDERVVGVMYPKDVFIERDDSAECFSGKMFSILISQIVESPTPGSDQIEKAFDECWLGNQNSIVFQGWVRDVNGNRKTEIFKVDLPENLDFLSNEHLIEGSLSLRPQVPNLIKQQSVTNTLKGISSFRHWLRSSPDGKFVYFLMEDDNLIINIFELNLENNEILQLTKHHKSIHSPFNISPDGNKFIYFCDHQLMLYNRLANHFVELTAQDVELSGIPNFNKSGDCVFFNKYVKEKNTSKFLQIFKLEL